MRSANEQRGARIVVEKCANVTADEDVLIVADYRSYEAGERLTAAAHALGANTSLVSFKENDYDGQEPPQTVAASMQEVDVVLLVCYRSVTHSTAVNEAVDNGARILSLSKFQSEQFIEGGLYADYETMRPMCEQMTELFTTADEAWITSPQGTDLTVDLTGREGNSHPGIVTEPGQLSGLTHIESNTSPREGGTDGTAVFDGAIPNLDIGVLETPVTMEIENGSVVQIEGGRAADKISDVWDEYDVPAIYNIAQLAVGMNPESKYFNDWFSNNHGRYGNVHLGIGTSTNLGGEVRAPVHFDAMMAEPTLELDGDVVLADGEFVGLSRP